MNPINHFEIPFDNSERAIKFYKEVFGWEIIPMPDMNYTIVHTTPTNENQMPKEAGTINGGMYNRSDGGSRSPVLVITVPNLDKHIKKIQAHGGKITMEKRQVGKMGLYAQIKDTEGNIIGIWEALKK